MSDTPTSPTPIGTPKNSNTVGNPTPVGTPLPPATPQTPYRNWVEYYNTVKPTFKNSMDEAEYVGRYANWFKKDFEEGVYRPRPLTNQEQAAKDAAFKAISPEPPRTQTLDQQTIINTIRNDITQKYGAPASLSVGFDYNGNLYSITRDGYAMNPRELSNETQMKVSVNEQKWPTYYNRYKINENLVDYSTQQMNMKEDERKVYDTMMKNSQWYTKPKEDGYWPIYPSNANMEFGRDASGKLKTVTLSSVFDANKGGRVTYNTDYILSGEKPSSFKEPVKNILNTTPASTPQIQAQKTSSASQNQMPKISSGSFLRPGQVYKPEEDVLLRDVAAGMVPTSALPLDHPYYNAPKETVLQKWRQLNPQEYNPVGWGTILTPDYQARLYETTPSDLPGKSLRTTPINFYTRIITQDNVIGFTKNATLVKSGEENRYLNDWIRTHPNQDPFSGDIQFGKGISIRDPQNISKTIPWTTYDSQRKSGSIIDWYKPDAPNRWLFRRQKMHRKIYTTQKKNIRQKSSNPFSSTPHIFHVQSLAGMSICNTPCKSQKRSPVRMPSMSNAFAGMVGFSIGMEKPMKRRQPVQRKTSSQKHSSMKKTTHMRRTRRSL